MVKAHGELEMGTGNESLKNKTRSPFSRELNFDHAKVEIKQMYVVSPKRNRTFKIERQ